MSFLHKKSLGQHFLRDARVAQTMAQTGAQTGQKTALEIGPGQGVLTDALLAAGFQVIAVEKDDRLIPYLQEKYKKQIASGDITIIHSDILDLDSSILPISYVLIANIPYYITGEIIRTFLEAEKQPKGLILLMQKEVAQRIVEKDGKHSLLSLSVAFFGSASIIKTVPKGAFSPVPKVESAIIYIQTRVENKDKTYTVGFFDLLHAGFAHKRKKLYSNLLTIYQKELVDRAFAELNLDTNVRAERVDLHTWRDLYRIVGMPQKRV